MNKNKRQKLIVNELCKKYSDCKITSVAQWQIFGYLSFIFYQNLCQRIAYQNIVVNLWIFYPLEESVFEIRPFEMVQK